MAVHAPITRAHLTDLRIAGMMPFTGDDAIPLVDQAYSLLMALSSAFQTSDLGHGAANLSEEIVGNALEGVASLVALARFAIEPDGFAE